MWSVLCSWIQVLWDSVLLSLSFLFSVLGHYPGYLHCRSVRICPGICLQRKGKQSISVSVSTWKWGTDLTLFDHFNLSGAFTSSPALQPAEQIGMGMSLLGTRWVYKVPGRYHNSLWVGWNSCWCSQRRVFPLGAPSFYPGMWFWLSAHLNFVQNIVWFFFLFPPDLLGIQIFCKFPPDKIFSSH